MQSLILATQLNPTIYTYKLKPLPQINYKKTNSLKSMHTRKVNRNTESIPNTLRFLS